MTGFLSNTTKIGLGKDVFTLDVSPQFNAYSGVEIIVDDKTSYFSGNETGRILTINNPWGTQDQADNILSSLQDRGFQYQPFTASGALLNPAAELGDGVTISDTYSGLYRMTRNYSALMFADIEAPQDEEVDHEYPFESKQNREISRQFSAVESEFRIQSNEIAAKVSETGGNDSSVGWSLTSNAWTVKANGTEVFRIDKSGATVTGVIRATSGQIGGFNIGSSAIYSGMDSMGSASNGVYVGTDGIALGGGKFKVTASGQVSAANMTLTGTLNIGGTNISATALQAGAQSAYSNGGYWSGGVVTANNAYSIANTAQSTANSANSTATAAQNRAEQAMGYFSGLSTASNMLISRARISYLYLGGAWRFLHVTTINVSGTNYTVVGC